MGVEGDRVSPRQAGEELGSGYRGETAVSAVDMQPQAVGLRNASDLAERIDRASARCACSRDDRDRRDTRLPVLLDGRHKRVGAHPEGFIHWDEPQVGTADAKDRQRLGH